MYKIGQLAQITNISADTLRYYEKQGLLKPNGRSLSGYRIYSEDDLLTVQFIIRAKKVGFTLSDITELLSMQINKQAKSCQDVKAMTETKLVEVEDKITQLNKIKEALEKLNVSCCGGPESAVHCSILQALHTGMDTKEHHH